MSKLFETIGADLIQARRDKNAPKLKLIQTLIGAVEQQKSKNSGKKVLTVDEITLSTIKSFKKNIKDFLKVATNQDTIRELEFELEILDSYLPKQLTCDQILDIIKLNDLKTVPAGMQYFLKNYPSQYDSEILVGILKDPDATLS
jgi:uncharacterized protein YqeY